MKAIRFLSSLRANIGGYADQSINKLVLKT
jgi:hypothetical protein